MEHGSEATEFRDPELNIKIFTLNFYKVCAMRSSIKKSILSVAVFSA